MSGSESGPALVSEASGVQTEVSCSRFHSQEFVSELGQP